MKIKLDENVTVAAKAPLRAAGHQVDTVSDEGLTGTPDPALLDVCRREQRLLITFDVGFGDLRAYPPQDHAGIIVLRLRDQQPSVVLDVLHRLVAQHDLSSFSGALAIAGEDRVRIRRE